MLRQYIYGKVVFDVAARARQGHQTLCTPLIQLQHRISDCLLATESASGENQTAGRLNHVAIAVPNLEAAAETFRTVLGTSVSEPQSLPDHGVRVVFVKLANTKLELVEPLGQASPISNFLKKNPLGGMHHICVEVGDIKVTYANLRNWVP